MPIVSSTSGRGSKLFTLFGWTPGVRALSGRRLACGCLTGTYRHWAGVTLIAVDARGRCCPHAAHQRDVVLWQGDEEDGHPILDDRVAVPDPS
jgi:hypothetical protein